MQIENDKSGVIDPAILNAIADRLRLDRLYLLSLKGAGTLDPDMRVIARAAAKMTPDERRKMLALLQESFPDEFRNTASDDLDDEG